MVEAQVNLEGDRRRNVRNTRSKRERRCGGVDKGKERQNEVRRRGEERRDRELDVLETTCRPRPRPWDAPSTIPGRSRS
jgi:hypothetical protein